MDSRKAALGTAFVAVKGTHVDGHDYIAKAVEAGAQVIVCEQVPVDASASVCYVKVADAAEALGQMASNFYGRPSEQFHLVGVTGTNGKTTIATLLFRLFTGLGFKCGLVSTVEYRIGDQVFESTHTTPDAISLNSLMAQMVEQGCTYVFMECSSHAIVQRRIAGLQFAGALFSNITHDHLDYHGTFQAYINAKKMFFDYLPATAFAVVNIDDKRGPVMVQNTAARVRSYALKSMADYKVRIIENNLDGLFLQLDGAEIHAKLVGDFNAYNLLAVYGAARELGFERDEILPVLSALESAEGRFDYVLNRKRNILGIVDYAHTPDALEKVLATIQGLRSGNEQVISVFGCGGDRDKTKRPLMAKAGCVASDRVILTSDNPRTEDPEAILNDMEAGVPVELKPKVLRISDRLQAIRTAVALAKDGDIILLAGKGHEKYQDIHGIKHPFDDKAILSETLLPL